jgi:hypothetical protein
MPSASRLAAFLLAASAAFVAPTNAQDKTIKLRFLGFPQVPDPEPVELLVGEGKTIKVDTPGHELSQPYSVPVLPSVTVGETVTNEKNESVFKEYGSAKAITAEEQIVLLIRKGRKPSDGFVVLPIDAGQAGFKAASYLFINASNLSVGGVIGDQKFALKPGQRRMLQPKPNHADGICQVTLAYMKGEEWKTVYDTRWPANDKFRSMVFFYQDPGTGRLGIVPIVDVLPYKGQ